MRYSRLGRRRLGVIVVMMLLVSLLMPLTALAAPAQSNGGNTQWVQVYTVQHGDTLSGIAARFGVSSEALMEANSIHNPNQIYVGQQLIIPANDEYSHDEYGQDDEYSQGKGGPECASYYTVRHGDTLSEIALYSGVDQDYLAHANAISDDNDIYVGQSLCIPSQQGGDNYHQQPQQPAQQPEQPTQQPQQPAQQPQQPQQYPQNKAGCDPCGQSQNDEPQHSDNDEHNDSAHQDDQSCDSCAQQQNNSPHNDGDHPDNQQCDSCGQQQNGGSQNNAPQNNAPQNNNQGCGDSCGQPQDNGPHNDGDHSNNQPCDSCGQQQNNSSQNNGDHQGQPCNCDGSNDDDHYDDGHQDGHGPQLQPTDYWKGEYYNDKYFGKFFAERQDLDVNFNWGTGAPIEGMNKDRFSVRWERVVSFKGGPTRFKVTADDGVRVYVDDQLIIDHWVIQPATDFTADVNLRPGPHKVVVEYYEEAEDAVIHVSWEQVDHHDYNDDHDSYN